MHLCWPKRPLPTFSSCPFARPFSKFFANPHTGQNARQANRIYAPLHRMVKNRAMWERKAARMCGAKWHIGELRKQRARNRLNFTGKHKLPKSGDNFCLPQVAKFPPAFFSPNSPHHFGIFIYNFLILLCFLAARLMLEIVNPFASNLPPFSRGKSKIRFIQFSTYLASLGG